MAKVYDFIDAKLSITILAKYASIRWKDGKINLIGVRENGAH